MRHPEPHACVGDTEWAISTALALRPAISIHFLPFQVHRGFTACSSACDIVKQQNVAPV